MVHNKKKLCGGYFDSEENAAMKVNLMCDKIEKERKNPMINIHSNAIPQVMPSFFIMHQKTRNNSLLCKVQRKVFLKETVYDNFCVTQITVTF